MLRAQLQSICFSCYYFIISYVDVDSPYGFHNDLTV